MLFKYAAIGLLTAASASAVVTGDGPSVVRYPDDMEVWPNIIDDLDDVDRSRLARRLSTNIPPIHVGTANLPARSKRYLEEDTTPNRRKRRSVVDINPTKRSVTSEQKTSVGFAPIDKRHDVTHTSISQRLKELGVNATATSEQEYVNSVFKRFYPDEELAVPGLATLERRGVPLAGLRRVPANNDHFIHPAESKRNFGGLAKRDLSAGAAAVIARYRTDLKSSKEKYQTTGKVQAWLEFNAYDKLGIIFSNNDEVKRFNGYLIPDDVRIGDPTKDSADSIKEAQAEMARQAMAHVANLTTFITSHINETLKDVFPAWIAFIKVLEPDVQLSITELKVPDLPDN